MAPCDTYIRWPEWQSESEFQTDWLNISEEIKQTITFILLFILIDGLGMCRNIALILGML